MAAPVGASVYKNGVHNHNASGSWQQVDMDTEVFDTDALHDPGTNPSRLTVPGGRDGKYLVVGAAWWPSSDTSGTRYTRLYLNGTTELDVRANQAGAALRQNVSVIVELDAGDYIELGVYQDSGGSKDVGDATNDAALFLQLIRVAHDYDKKYSELGEATTIDPDDEFSLNAGGSSSRVKASTMRALLGGSFSPYDTPPTSPDAFDDEFDDSASLSDWTAFGDTPTTEDINTTVPGRLFMYRSAPGPKLAGRYKSITIPGTYKVAMGDSNVRSDYARGLNIVILPTGAISDSSPAVGIGFAWAGSLLAQFIERMSSLSAYAATISNGDTVRRPKGYWQLVFNSTTSVDIYWSADGIVMIPITMAYNPGWAMDKLGWGMRSDTTTAPLMGTWDWVRRLA